MRKLLTAFALSLALLSCSKDNDYAPTLTNYVSVERDYYNVIPGTKEIQLSKFITASLTDGAFIVIEVGGTSPQLQEYTITAKSRATPLQPSEACITVIVSNNKYLNSTGKPGSKFKITNKGIDFANVELTDGNELYISNANF